MADTIDFSRFTGGRTAESDEVARQQAPQLQLRPKGEVERHPSFFQKTQEKEGRSEWSGASMGGGVWAGRAK